MAGGGAATSEALLHPPSLWLAIGIFGSIARSPIFGDVKFTRDENELLPIGDPCPLKHEWAIFGTLGNAHRIRLSMWTFGDLAR